MGNPHPDMEAFKGKFTRTSAENFEEFLKALNVNMILRKAATVSTPVMEITAAGDMWSIKTWTTLKSMDLKFKLGEEFDEMTPDGRQTRALINVEGNGDHSGWRHVEYQDLDHPEKHG